MTTGTIDPNYGDASATPPEWTDVEARLTAAQLYWLVTVRRDGRPHAVPLCGVWDGGSFVFATGDSEQKMRNLQSNPQVTVTAGPLGAAGWAHGKDISVEGVAERVVDDTHLRALAALWYEKYGDDWVYEVRDGQFCEVSGSGDGHGGAGVFRVAPSKAIVFGDEHRQTTFRL